MAHSTRTLFGGAFLPMDTPSPNEAAKQATTPRLTVVNPATLYDPAPNGYSHAVVVEGGSRLAFIAGQGGEDAAGTLSPDFENQVRKAFANLATALVAVGAEPNQVATLTTYVADYDQSRLAIVTAHIKALFGHALPAQSLVPVPRLALDGMLFEVDAVAVLK